MGLLGPPKVMKTPASPLSDREFLRIQNPEVRIWYGV
jgi:hypothetical protein